jgi:myo-inositol-hexaphosphate 3-phosphohydrolase
LDEDSMSESAMRRRRRGFLARCARLAERRTTAASLALSVLLLAGCAAPPSSRSAPRDAIVRSVVETAPTPSDDDAADDPAIWLHPTDPAQSLILGSDKAAGLGIYDLSGTRIGFLAAGSVNNVDVSVLETAGGETAIAAGTARDENAVAVWTIDPVTRELTRADGGRIVSGLPDVYGFALARFSGTTLALVTSKAGMLEIIELTMSGGRVGAGPRAAIPVGGQLEGVVADPASGSLYVGEEGVGIWRYTLVTAPDGTIDWEETASLRRLIDTCRDTQGVGNLTSDVEGLALWAPEGSEDGYLIASSQGDDRFCVYEPARRSGFVGSFRIRGSRRHRRRHAHRRDRRDRGPTRSPLPARPVRRAGRRQHAGASELQGRRLALDRACAAAARVSGEARSRRRGIVRRPLAPRSGSVDLCAPENQPSRRSSD